MILVDANVPMYLVGARHPNKDRALALVTRFIGEGERLITNVEVYQEILHRYSAVRRGDAIDHAFAALDGIVDEILTVDMADVRAARWLLAELDGLSARDAVHVAVMQRVGVSRIFSFDAGFDGCPGITRLS